MQKFFVSICFDDGWKSTFQNGVPLLDKYGVTATFYIISERVSGNFPAYMRQEELRALVSKGHEIGSHTRSHKHLPVVSDKEIWDEISLGLQDLEELGFSPKTFAYPFGEWNPYVVKQVREVGFLAARSIIKDVNNERTDPYLLRAHSLREEHSAEDVIGWISKAREVGGWFILFTHQVESAEILREKGMLYGTTPEVLEGIEALLTSA